MPRRTAALLGAAGKRLPTNSGTITQTLGVGGIPTASGANVTLISADSGSTLNITTSNRIYDGQGHTVPKITIAADGVTVQNFYIRGGGNAGIYSTGSNNTIQNCDIAQIDEGGEGDINGITFFGDGTSILFNAIGKGAFLVDGDPNGSHTDGIQTWNTSSKRASSNVTIKGNWIDGPTASDDRYLHQGVTAEGNNATSGGGGGTGNSATWTIDGNYFRTYGNQVLELRDIQNVIVTRNTFAGGATKIVNSGDGSTVTYYSDNIVTGSYPSGVGVSVTSGSGPGGDTTSGGTGGTTGGGTGGTGTDGTQAATLLGWGTPDATWSDEFAYTGAPNSSKWSVYNSAGHAGNGVRSPSRVTVADGKMILTGLADSANTAGMAHKLTRTYGRYEVRCRSFYTNSLTPPVSPTNGSGGLLTDRTSVSYSNGTKTSTYHIYASGLDWSMPVGLLVYGDGSGEYGLANLADTYLMAGTNGLINVAKKHNLILVTPRAPGNGCTDGDGVCWYLGSNDGTTRAQKTKWLDDLIKTQVLAKYNIDKTRVCIAGFSSGAENAAGIYGPQYAASWMEDGLLLAISYGSSPDQYGITDTYTAGFRSNVAVVWDVRGGDETTAVADSLDGYNWYTAEGFATLERNVIPGGQHDRPGEFGAIVDQYVTEYVRPASTPGAAEGGYHPVLIIWPANDDWPGNGEMDFLENGEPGEQAAGAFMHYPSLDGNDHQIEVPTKAVDLRQFHNFAFEWSPTGVKCWIDGVLWFSYSGGAAADRKNIQAMVGGQLTVQLDAFQATGLIASTFELEWVRIYAAP